MSTLSAERALVLPILTRQGVRDSRIRTAAFAYLFAIYSWVQPYGFRHAYPTEQDRIAFAASFGNNIGLRLLYGQPHDITTVTGYTAWRVGGVLAIAAGLFGVLAAVRALRTEEESGRNELILAGVVDRRVLFSSAVAAITLGIGLLWAAEFLGFVVGGLPVAGAAYLALATVTVAAVFAGVGGIASQVASTRRGALGLGGAIFALSFLFRVLADTVHSLGWLRWATPLGWAELLRPFANPQPLVLILPVLVGAALLFAAYRLSTSRDIGTGMVPRRDVAEPNTRLLSSSWSQALRSQLGGLLTWFGTVAVFMFILGVVSHGISTGDVPENLQEQLEKLGAGSITTPTGYMAFLFLFVVLAVCVFSCTLVGAARQEELGQQLETLLARPISRYRWLGGRLLLGAFAVVVISLLAGLGAWAGARTTGVQITLPSMLEAGINAVPSAALFLGLAGLLYAVVPRSSTGIAYGLVVVAFLWQIVGSLLTPPRWVLDITPFAHVGLVPTEPFRATAAAVLLALGLVAAVGALWAFRRRDLTG